MARSSDLTNMAVFCDFENIALGVRDAKYEKFDIGKIIERLLLKGSIVVKKAYCDWDRYKAFKAPMHEAAFELIEIPHVRQSGKNSADIRMVVDALDLCYTKAHVDAFVIVSGDSDFSPLVSKLRENDKAVIGIGVKNSTSDLFIANCDEFIFYDDLVREGKKQVTRRATRTAPKTPARKSSRPEAAEAAEAADAVELAEAQPGSPAPEQKRQQALDLVVETIEALMSERGAEDKIWGSMVKQALKRRKPGFNESYYGFRSFNAMLEEAAKHGAIELERDEKSGGCIVRVAVDAPEPEAPAIEMDAPAIAAEPAPRAPRRRADGRPREPRSGRRASEPRVHADRSAAEPNPDAPPDAPPAEPQADEPVARPPADPPAAVARAEAPASRQTAEDPLLQPLVQAPKESRDKTPAARPRRRRVTKT